MRMLLSTASRSLAATIVLCGLLTQIARAEVTIQEVVSPGGIKAWLVEDYTVPIIAMRFSFSGGSTQDPAGKAGLVNMMSALFDEGAGDLDSDAFQTRLDTVGGEMGFSASSDDLSGSFRVLADDNTAAAVTLLATAVNQPRFDTVPLERIRSQLIAGIRSNQNDPDRIAAEKWENAVFPGHPYAEPNRGTEASLGAVTRDDIVAMHKRLLARDNLKIGVVGAIAAGDLAKMLDEVFADLPAKAETVPVPDVEPVLGQTVQAEYDLPQTTLQLTYPAVPRKDPKFFAAHLMNQVLGGGSTARLYEEIREKRGLAYGAGSGIATLDHTQYLSVSTATRSDRAGETLQLLRSVIGEYAKNGPTPQELSDAKRYVIGSYAIANLQTSGAIAATLVGLQEADLGIDYINRRADLINAVTLEETRAIAAELLSAAPALLVVGPALDTKEAETEQAN